MNTYIINSIGLSLDIIGAWFIATEVVYQFKGKKLTGKNATWGDPASEETPEYKTWEKSKYIKMWIGLIFLTIGFGLQIYSNLALHGNKNNVITINEVINTSPPVIVKAESSESPQNINASPDINNESQKTPLNE